MAGAVPGADNIAQLIEEEAQALEAFVAVLRKEQAVLTGGDTDALPPLVNEKSVLVERLTALAGRRERQLAGRGLGAGQAGIEKWLATEGGDRGRASWRQLLDQAAEARNLNELNGKLINLRMQHHQQALTTLMAAADRAITYGPDGQQRTGGGGRFLGSA